MADEYIFDVEKIKPLRDTERFRKPAIFFEKNGEYPKFPDGSIQKKRHWDQEIERSLMGITVNDDFMPGYMYFYLNYTPMQVIKEAGAALVDSDFISSDREEGLPDYYDGDYEYFLYLYEAERRGKHAVVLKSRGKGFSFKAAAMLCRNYFLIKKSVGYAIASDKEFLLKDALLTKTWATMAFIDTHTPWRKRRQYHNTDMWKRASFEKDKIESGYLSDIYGVSTHNDPDKVRGKRGKLFLYEESGVNPNLLESYNANLPSVQLGKKTFGMIIPFGCVCAGTKVWTNNGSLINIEDIRQSDGILGYDGGGAYKENIEWLKPPAKKPCYRITTSGGDHIECSEDHPLMWTKTHWRKRLYRSKEGIFNKNIGKFVTFTLAKDVSVGDQLVTIDEVPVFGNRSVRDARLLGMMIGDGNYSHGNTPQLSCTDEEIHQYVSDNYNISIYKDYELKNGEQFRSIGFPGFRGVMEEAGIYGQVKNDKRLPLDIHEYDKESLSELLAGYFDADGHVAYYKNRDSIRVVLTSNVRPLLEEVKYQLVKFGIHGKICKENRSGGYEGGQPFVFRLYITTITDVIRFRDNVKLLCGKKQQTLDRVVNCSSLDRTRIENGYFKLNPDNDKGHFFIGKEKMKGMRVETVSNVEYIGERDVYNMHTGHTNTYISNRFITKQTGGTVGANFAGLKEMFNNPEGYNILPCRNVWSNSRYGKKSGFFFPAHKNLEGFIGLDGISDLKAGEEHEFRQRKIKAESTTDPNQLRRYVAENCMTPEEAMLRITGTMFPVQDLEEHLEHVLSHDKDFKDKERIGRFTIDIESGNVKWKVDKSLNALYDFPIRDNRYMDGAIVIYEPPQATSNGTIPYGIYIAGTDPYDDDESTTTSLGSTLILNRLTDRIVAEYTGRPATAKIYYENVRRLLKFYNAKCNYENNKKGMFGHFENKNSLYMLADTPKILKDQELAKISLVGNKALGTHASEPVNKWGRELIKTWLMEPAVTAISGNIMNLHKVRSIPLLKELIEWAPDVNCDRVAALGMLMILREDMMKIVAESERGEPTIDEFFTRSPLFRENLIKQSPFSK